MLSATLYNLVKQPTLQEITSCMVSSAGEPAELLALLCVLEMAIVFA